MKHFRLRLLLMFFAASGTWAQTNPMPFVNQPLVPSSTPPGGSTFTLTVHGSGFVKGATVNWNGGALATAFVNVDELTATVLASDIAVATSAAVTVTNPAPGGGASNVVYFQVSAPTTLQFSTSPSSTSLPSDQFVETPPIVADFKQYGILDMLIMTAGPSLAPFFTGSMALGNGDGSFQAPIQPFPGVGASGTPKLGDFNGDGIPDMVIPSCFLESLSSCEIGVWLGNGDGTFSHTAIAQNVVTFGQPVLGDFNGDGKLDVAVPTSSGITVLLGNGDGTLQSGVLSSITNVGSLNAVGDFDGDGKLDLIGTTSGISFFHGNGDGTFSAPSTSYPVAQSLNQILAADLNGDGKLDLITIMYNQAAQPSIYSFAVMLGKGDGTFEPSVAYPVNANLGGPALGDFSANGKLDLAFPNTTNTIIVPGNGDGTFDLTNVVTLSVNTFSLASGDFNNDGKLDLAVSYQPPGPGGPPSAPGFVTYLLQDTPLAGLSKTSLTFAAQPLGTTSSPQSVTLMNNGTGPMNLWNVAITGTNSGDFVQTNNCPVSVGVGVSCQIDVSFAPTANGPRSASLSLSDNAPASPHTVALSGSGGLAAVQLSASTIGFGNEPVGNTSTSQSITVTNSGYSTMNISSISVIGTNAVDFSETNTCGSTLAASANCTISVTFTPAALGSRSAALTITDDAPGSPQTITLNGSGISTLGLSPSSVTFSGQYVGTSSLPMSVTLTNNGVSPLTINTVAASPSDFGTLSACGSSVAPGASCSIGVFFDPTASGTRTGTLTITDSAAGSPQTVALSGMGQDFSVTASSSTATVTSGQTASYTIAITPGGGFNKTVALSCSGSPASSTCNVSPSSVTLNGSSPTSVGVMVATGLSSSSSLSTPFGFPPVGNLIAFWFSLVWFVVLTPLCISIGRTRRRPVWWIRGLAFVCMSLLGMLLSSCSGGGGMNGGGGTPAGTYNLMVTGTFSSGTTTLSNAVQLTLVVK